MSNNNSSQSRSLWMGDIEHWMNEEYIRQVFKDYGKIIKFNSYFLKKRRP